MTGGVLKKLERYFNSLVPDWLAPGETFPPDAHLKDLEPFTLEYVSSGGYNYTKHYMVTRKLAVEAEQRLSGPLHTDYEKQRYGMKRFCVWFEKAGAILHCTDGPAEIMTHTNGTKVERYYRYGKEVLSSKPIDAHAGIPPLTLNS